MKLPEPPADRRDLGLDAVRTLAIALVLVSHTSLFFAYGPAVALLVDYTGWLGVEVFFSLSGFLIGRIMLTLARGPLDRATVTTFLARRWLRTLPLYYLVLLVLLALGWKLSWVDFTLLHGFVPSGRWGLVTAWSLGVEEFFYLAFPLLMAALVGMRAVGTRSAVPVTACTMLAAGWLFRLAYYLGIDPTGSALEWFRSNPLLRIDACAFGVLLACALQNRGWRPSGRIRLVLFGGFAIAAIAGSTVRLAIDGLGPQHATARAMLLVVNRLLLWPALDLAAVGAILGLLGVWRRREGVFAGAVRFGSRTSYGLYLIHVPVFYYVTVYAPGWLQAGGQFALALGLSLLLAGLGYWLIEAPILAWRDRRLPVVPRESAFGLTPPKPAMYGKYP
jgi:peptidoglycan/LPS O-acetylase OafA/YrhL